MNKLYYVLKAGSELNRLLEGQVIANLENNWIWVFGGQIYARENTRKALWEKKGIIVDTHGHHWEKPARETPASPQQKHGVLTPTCIKQSHSQP